MQKPRLILLQVMGIILLMIGYFISDRPDSESVMHFDLSSSNIITAVKHTSVINGQSVIASSDDHTPHKQRGYKHFSFKVILPMGSIVSHPVLLAESDYTYPLHETYYYLFCKEINPPPPKQC